MPPPGGIGGDANRANWVRGRLGRRSASPGKAGAPGLTPRRSGRLAKPLNQQAPPENRKPQRSRPVNCTSVLAEISQAAPALTEVASGSYILRMRVVGLKVLKNRLSEYVRLAARGEAVLITDRDTVVAEIVPPRPGRSPMLADALLAEAVRRGWITPPAFASVAAMPRKPIMSFRQLMREIEADREERDLSRYLGGFGPALGRGLFAAIKPLG